MLRRILQLVLVVLLVVGVGRVARAAEFSVELNGARVQDVVCLTSDIVHRETGDVPKGEEEKQAAAATAIFTALDSGSMPALSAQLNSVLPKYDDAFDWSWLAFKIVRPKRKYIDCTANSVPRTAAQVRLLVVDMAVIDDATTKRALPELLLGPISLQGTLLRVVVRSRNEHGPVDEQHEVAFEVVGGHYATGWSTRTVHHNATLNAVRLFKDFSVQLPAAPDQRWNAPTVESQGKKTLQASVDAGVLEGTGLPYSEIVVTSTTCDATAAGPTRLRYRVGPGDLEVERAIVTWSPPPSTQKLARERLTQSCPTLTLADQGLACSPGASANGVCTYTCERSGGFPLPARVRFDIESVAWEDTLTRGSFELRSFASPAPSLILVPAHVSKDFPDSYLTVATESDLGDRGAILRYHCDDEKNPCPIWTTRIPASGNIGYHYRAPGVRFLMQSEGWKDGAFSLHEPERRNLSVTLRSGMVSSFRFAANMKPTLGGALALDLGVPLGSSFMLMPSIEWRVATRSVDSESDGSHVPYATSALVPSAAALWCLPCAHGDRFIGWIGGSVGASASYPIVSSGVERTGPWAVDPEVGLIYRIQPAEGWFGAAAFAGGTRDSRWLLDREEFDPAFALRVNLSAWAYLY